MKYLRHEILPYNCFKICCFPKKLQLKDSASSRYFFLEHHKRAEQVKAIYKIYFGVTLPPVKRNFLLRKIFHENLNEAQSLAETDVTVKVNQ